MNRFGSPVACQSVFVFLLCCVRADDVLRDMPAEIQLPAPSVAMLAVAQVAALVPEVSVKSVCSHLFDWPGSARGFAPLRCRASLFLPRWLSFLRAKRRSVARALFRSLLLVSLGKSDGLVGAQR